VDINQIIGTEIQMEQYLPYAVSYDDPASSKTYKIVGIIKNDSSHVRYSYEDFVDLYDIQVFPYALYFDDVNSIAKAYNPINDELFYLENPYLEGVYNILNVISVFKDFFVIITIAITILCILILVGFGRKSIKRRMYEIGVIRALGAKNKELYFVFLIQISSMLILVSIISYVSLIYLDNYINSLLINNIMIFAQNELIKDLAILEYSPFVITLNLLFVTLITVLCSLLLMITLRNIKPIKIIRRDDE
jgi:ABC-type antimicrobial peptide transport system permease subunit